MAPGGTLYPNSPTRIAWERIGRVTVDAQMGRSSVKSAAYVGLERLDAPAWDVERSPALVHFRSWTTTGGAPQLLGILSRRSRRRRRTASPWCPDSDEGLR